MVNESFDKMSEAFGTSFSATDTSIKTLQNEVAVLETNKNALVEKTKNTSLVLEDQIFIQEEIKNMIVGSRLILQKIDSDIKIGSAPREYEARSRVQDSITNLIRELRNLNRDVVEMKFKRGDFDDGNLGNNKISMTSDQLFELIEKAQARSEVNKIDATFVVQDDGEE